MSPGTCVWTCSIAPYTGPGLPPDQDKTWPLDYWRGHVCTDIRVDTQTGVDQEPRYDSNYTRPFKTLKAAIVAANMCDRILLKPGQVYVGRIGLYRPNMTIMADPAASGGAAGAPRPVVRCTRAADETCIIMGDGLYDGAAHVSRAMRCDACVRWCIPCACLSLAKYRYFTFSSTCSSCCWTSLCYRYYW